jgi:transposase
VPSVEQEQKRALIRNHLQIMADRGRFEARGKGLLCAQGIEVHGRWWKGKGWQELQTNPLVADWMREQLEDWRQKVLSAQEQQEGLRERIEALAPKSLPKGVGAYSAAVLEYEMKGFARFKNRRQVASYTGLCPGIHRAIVGARKARSTAVAIPECVGPWWKWCGGSRSGSRSMGRCVA